MTIRVSEKQRGCTQSYWGIAAFYLCAAMVVFCLSHIARAESKEEAGGNSGLASSAPTALAPSKVDEHPHNDEDDGSFQGLEEQKRILDAARKALAVHSRTVHDSMSMSFQNIDNKHLLDRDATMRLVGIYENMRPRDAAAVFNVMDPHVLVAIASEMNTRKLSAIMAQMSRDRVNIVSQYLVGVRHFRQKSNNGSKEKASGELYVSVPQGTTPYNPQMKTSSGSAPFMPSRQ